MNGFEPVFVTGATGFIGSRLVASLVAQGVRVKALSRRERPESPPGWDASRVPPLEDPLVELVRGDILDRESLERGMSGCRAVYHLAAYAHNWAKDPATYTRLNIDGMRNVFASAIANKVDRVVWTSSIVTLGPTRPGVVGDEEMPRTTSGYLTEYEESKSIAEREALRLAATGFPLVIVNPTRVYGPGYLTEGNALAKLIEDYDRGRVPILFNCGVNVGNYVFVDDVVAGHELAMRHGRVGQRYILGGENVTLRKFFRTIDRVSGKRHFQLPMLTFTPLVFAMLQKMRAEWFGVYPTITPGWIRTFSVEWAYSHDKAARELGYRPKSLEEGIRITYEWLKNIGRVRA
jgi:farnesol dehydrogenase